MEYEIKVAGVLMEDGEYIGEFSPSCRILITEDCKAAMVELKQPRKSLLNPTLIVGSLMSAFGLTCIALAVLIRR